MPVMKPLTVREWLEQERLSGLPHADFAADALADLDRLDAYDEDDTPLANDDLEEIEKHVADFEGRTVVDRVEMAVKQLDDLIGIHGGEYGTVVARAEAADLRWWDIWDVLVEASVVDRNDSAVDVDVPGLLRMFLPS
jgi:hypothetical protein